MIYQEDIVVINTMWPYKRAPKYIKWLLTDLKGETDSSTKTVEDFNTPTYINECTIHVESQQEKSSLKWNIRPDGLDRFVQNVPCKMKQNTHSSQVHMDLSQEYSKE